MLQKVRAGSDYAGAQVRRGVPRNWTNDSSLIPFQVFLGFLDYSFFFFSSALTEKTTGLVPFEERVPVLPTRSSNNSVPMGAKVSAIEVTPKIFFERLYWFQDWAHLSPESTVRVLPHPHYSLYNYFSIFVHFFPDISPPFFPFFSSRHRRRMFFDIHRLKWGRVFALATQTRCTAARQSLRRSIRVC